MEVTITDPEGPLPSRALIPMIGLAVFALGFELEQAESMLVAGLVLVLASRLLTPRRSRRIARLECRKGVVVVRRAGILSQTLRAQNVLGATLTSASIALCTKGRRLPIVIDCTSTADLARIREALGIGPQGMGTVEWSLRAHPIEWADALARGLLAAAWGAFLLASKLYARTEPWPFWLDRGLEAALTVMVPLVPVLYVVRRAWPRETIELHEGGLSIRAPNLRAALRLGEVSGIEVRENEIVLSGRRRIVLKAPPSRWLASGMSIAERKQLAAFVTAAIEREKQGGEHADARNVEAMRRGEESVRAWLARLDATAVSPEGAGYRANALDVAVLWRVFEDPDEDADLRAAAARMLSRGAAAEMKVRVAPILSTVRDATTRKRIEATLDPDMDAAVEALEAMEADRSG